MFGIKKKDARQDPRYLVKITGPEQFLRDPIQLREYVNLGYTREQIAVLLGSFMETALMALYYQKAVERNVTEDTTRPHVEYLERTVSSVIQYRRERYQDEELTPEECYRAYAGTVDSSRFLEVMVHTAEGKAGHRIDRKAFVDGSAAFFKTEMRHLVTGMYREKMKHVPRGERAAAATEEDRAALIDAVTADYLERNRGKG